MKKTLLAMTVLSTLFLAGTANAAVAEAPSGTAGGGELSITGTITNDSPNWAWEIPAKAVADAKDWTVAKITGKVVGVNTEYNFASKGPITALNGVMIAPAATGGTGLTPVIKLNGTELADIDLSKSVTGNPAVVVLNAVGDSGEEGTFTVGLKTYGAVAYHNGGVWGSNAGPATDLLKAQPYYNELYAGMQSEPLQDWTLHKMLKRAETKKVTAAVTMDLIDFDLAFPTDAQPATWNASLPIVISLK